MKDAAGGILRKIKLIPTLVSLIVLLFSLALMILQFTGIFPLNPNEQMSLELLLLILISGTLLVERFSIFKEILEKLDKPAQAGENKTPQGGNEDSG
jgi:RsiW-degrading membrane proteinase PrsW (M82 family)